MKNQNVVFEIGLMTSSELLLLKIKYNRSYT